MDQSANHVLLRGSQPAAADRMRDLLARTVQDHVSDQRSHASALEEIRNILEGLEWLVKEVRQHEETDLSGQLAAQTEGLLRQLAEARENLPAWAESLPEHIRTLSAQVRPVAELPARWADLGVVSENVDQVLPRLQALCDMIAQAKEMLQAQEERLAKLEQNDLRLQQTMESAAGRFSRLDKAMAELSRRAGYLDKEMSALKGRIDQGFAAQTARLEQSVAALSGTLDEGLDDKLGALDAKLSGADGKVGALANRIDRLDDRIGDTDDRIGFINERIASIDDRIGALDGRMDGLLTLAEALLRPVRHIADQRREGERS
jgi:chromosome segregation ATPase